MAKTKRTSGPIPSKTLRHRAEEMAGTSPTDIAGMTSPEVQRLIHELQVHQIELELQNEELRQAQVELAHSRDQYAELYEFAPTGYVTLDSDGKIQNANLTTAAMLGVARQHLLQASLSNFVNPESQDEFYLHRRAVLSSETKQTCEVRMEGADARGLTVRLESSAFGPEHDRRCRTSLIDITKRKVAEETLRLLNIDLGRSLADRTGELQQNIKQVKLLTEAVSHLGEGVLITSDKLDWPGPHIVFVNNALCQITGYTAEELIGQSPRVLQGDDSNRETLDRIKAELSAGRSVLAEVINYRKEGTPYDAELFITPLFNAEGRRTNFVSIHRDITERRRAENLLRQERNRAQQYLDVSGVIMVALNSLGEITLINRKGCEVLGCDEHELLGKNWFDTCLPEGSRNDVQSIFQQIMNGTVANAEYFENSVLTTTGEERIIEWHNTEIRDETGRVVGALGSGTDITGRRQAERALRDREERMQAILNTAADAIVTIDRRGIITAVNLATEQMFGYTQDELVGQNVKILMPPPYRDEHDGYIQHYLETAKARMIGIGREVVGRRKDGSLFPIGLAVSEVDHLGLFTGVIRDISERRKLQRDVMRIAEDEQRRIGQDLHDSTQQELAGLGMLSQTLFRILTRESGDRPKASVDIDKCCELTKKILDGLTRAHQELRSISRGLVPIRLDPAGLMDALRELASRMEEVHGVTCAFKCEYPVEVAESFTATHLYRIAQEALTNALKHARPEHILIALESENGHPILQVADDGTGFNSSEKSEGMGLKTMQYRASLIGAKLAISPIDTGGTLVTCKVFGGGVNCDD